MINTCVSEISYADEVPAFLSILFQNCGAALTILGLLSLLGRHEVG